MNRSHHTVADLVADPLFVEWILRPTPRAVVYWRRWQEKHPDQHDMLEEARRTVLLLHFKETNFSQKSARDLQSRIEATIDREPSAKSSRSTIIRYPAAAAIAASVLLLLTTALWLWHSNRPVVYTTAYGETQTILLPDSSEVTLNANSTLTHPAHWESQPDREVSLRGEAFFRVREKPDSVKFTVHTDQLDVEVLGTEFNVNTRRRATKVVLSSGKVRLRSERAREMTMKPGELVVLSDDRTTYEKKVVNPEQYQAWKERRLEFINTPVPKILQELEDTYGFRITIDTDRLDDKRYTGSTPANDVPLLLDKLAKLYGLRIRQEDRQIRVSEY